MAIRRETVTVTAAGGAGTSSGSGKTQQPVHGPILAVYLDYTGAPATTDVTIAEAGQSPAQPVLTVLNSNTDKWFYPRVKVQGVTDGADIAGPVDYQNVADHLLVSVAQADNGNTVAATIIWDDLR